MKRISVIVPVYNAEEYICRCIDSILDQTYVDFELILVNDGSTDSSAKILDEYASKDKRIHVIHKKNGGHASARNRGIDKAFESDSKWISFIDSDDWVSKYYLEYLYRAVDKEESDLSICGFKRAYSIEDDEEESKYEVVTYVPENFWCQSRINATIPCGKLFNKEMFRDIRWPNKVHDDEHMTYKLLFACDKISFVNIPLYNYYYNENSVMVSSWSPKRVDSVYAIKERREYFSSRKFTKALELDNKLYIEELYNTICNFREIKKDYKEIYGFLLHELRRELKINGKSTGYTWEKADYMYLQAFPYMKCRYYFKCIKRKIVRGSKNAKN